MPACSSVACTGCLPAHQDLLPVGGVTERPTAHALAAEREAGRLARAVRARAQQARAQRQRQAGAVQRTLRCAGRRQLGIEEQRAVLLVVVGVLKQRRDGGHWL